MDAARAQYIHIDDVVGVLNVREKHNRRVLAKVFPVLAFDFEAPSFLLNTLRNLVAVAVMRHHNGFEIDFEVEFKDVAELSPLELPLDKNELVLLT